MLAFSLIHPLLYLLAAPTLWMYWRWLSPRARPFAITFISCIILGSSSPVFFLYVLGLAYAVPKVSQHTSPSTLRIAGFAIGLLTIVLWKYIFGFYAAALGAYFGLPSLFALIGITFMALRVTGLLLLMASPQKPTLTFLQCLNFLTFFPTLTAGPLENYTGFTKGYTPIFDNNLFVRSLYKILFGLFKKFIVLEYLFQIRFGAQIDAFTQAPGNDPGSYTRIDILVLALLLFIKTLLDISSYNDLARGFAGLFGYNIINDIHYPLGVRNLSEYWRNWHISVMRWCQTHIYFPVFLWKKSVLAGTIASLLVMGLWHDVEWKWFVWGLYQATGLFVLHLWMQRKVFRPQWTSRVVKTSAHIASALLTLGFTSMAFVIVGPPDFNHSLNHLATLLGLH